MNARALVLRAAGTNCDEETAHALTLAGARAELLHVNRLVAEPQLLDRFQLLALPGGFTFGDDVASGAVLAHILEERLEEAIARFVERGRLVIGICNGFQILVRIGILPGSRGRGALLKNLSARFEDRWVRLRAGPAPGPWLEPGREYHLPVAHAEGRFEWFPDEPGEALPEVQVALRYRATGDGENATGAVPYPANPNGSHEDIAGITNPRGNVLGLMPHPERFLSPLHHPSWSRYRRPDGSAPRERDLPEPLGLDLLRRAVRSLD
ncbi:MAG: phosphoribosylformylglycinamidine synthase I [Planctomycetota bacterium]